jgi:uncharacterized coiled-coil protein SlyX
MGEDYSKLKNIMDNMQGKMTHLVQENSKLNKSLYEQPKSELLTTENNALKMRVSELECKISKFYGLN